MLPADAHARRVFLPLLALAAVLAVHAAADVDLSSPRATIRSFFEAMSAVQGGNEARIEEAFHCLYVGDELSEAERLDTAATTAHKLYEILDNVRFELEAIAEEVGGDTYTAELGSGDRSIALKLHRYDDGQWRFNSQTLDSARLAELQAAVTGTLKPEDENGPQFNEGLKSPRAAIRTFLFGMDERDGLTRENAVAALDLSDFPKSVRAEKGLELALQLKAVIDRYKRVEYVELPPESERPPYTFLHEPEGKIVLAAVTDAETDEQGWKFTKGTLESIERLYFKYKDKALAEGVTARELGLTLAIRLRDWIYDHFPFLLKRAIYLQNWQWLGLFVVILTGMAVSRLIAFFLSHGVRRWFSRARFHLDTKLEKDFVRPIRISLMAWFWLLGLTVLGLPPDALAYLRIAAQVVTAAGAVWALYRLIDIVGNYMTEKAARTENKFDDLLVPIVTRSLKIFIVVVAIVFLAEYNQWDYGSILTGLGLGGLAFALAAKDVVANIFGSFTILLDRPFQIGDWVIIGDVDGTVETVGIRSTRVRTFYNSLITVPNSELINRSVDNMGARRYRRIKTLISITYDTPPEKIEAFCEGIRQLIRKHPYTRKDYYHVYLNQFAAASLDILLYCFVEVPDWGTELRERHRLFNDIIRLAHRLGIEFAFPTQTLYMRQDQVREDVPAPGSPEKAYRLGRKTANAIVHEILGDETPPPVTFDLPSDSMAAGGDSTIADPKQIGDEGEQ